jgi:putative phage-type endonuclease
MTARLLIPPTATYEEWLARRAELSRTAVTASEIATVLGISPWGSPFNLFHLKRGTISSDYDDDVLSLGRHLEPWVADRWAADHPGVEMGLGGLFASVERPWQMATPDRLLDMPDEDGRYGDGVLEIKTSGSYDGWGEDGTDEIPPYYRAQVLWQLDTLDLKFGHVTCLFLSSRARRDYVIEYDEADVKLMRDAALEFLGRVERDEAPDIDHLPATAQALKQIHADFDPDAKAEVPKDLAVDYRLAKASLDDAQQHYDLLTNQIRAAMGEAKTAMCDGKKVAVRSVYTQTHVDAKQLRTDHPDAFAACRVTSTVDKITPSRAKKDTP